MDEEQARLSDVDSINNLDTARMTLRWALERLGVLEKAKGEMEKRGKDLESLRTAFQIQLEADRQKELYYRRMEELLTAYAKGDLDADQLQRKQTALHDLKRHLTADRPGAADEFEKKRSEIASQIGGQLDEEFGRLHRDWKDQLRSETREKELEALRRRENEFAARETELSKARIHLEHGERALAKREACLNAEHRERERELREEVGRLKGELLADHQSRVEAWNRERSALEQGLQKAWKMERDALIHKVKSWEDLSHGYLAHIIELEEQLLRGETQTFRRMEALESEFSASLSRLREKKSLWEQDSSQRGKELESERARMLEEIGKWRDELESVLAERSHKLEAEAARQQERWTRQEKEHSVRELVLRERQHKIETDLEVKHAQVAELRRCLVEAIRSYKNKRKEEQ